MNRLGEKIAALIRTAGPVSIADYMATCLFDPADGYYTTREPFGVRGDFTTAPEISQMFGELTAVWLVQAWRTIGCPSPVAVAEIGPGRGTLMKDMVRTISRAAPDLAKAADYALVEASPRLTAVQAETLKGSGTSFQWFETIDTLPEKPTLFVGNEIFDALPFRQFVHTRGRWLERVVGLDENDSFRFALGTASLAADTLPRELPEPAEGDIFEIAPVREAMMAQIASRIARHGGAGIFFDYGHLTPGYGDTFQALRDHQHVDVFERPGEADLTSHVDFSSLAAVARGHGLGVSTTTQGDFLLSMGLLERAGRLGSNADAATREAISSAVERLAGPDQMGKLFKAFAILPNGSQIAGFPSAS